MRRRAQNNGFLYTATAINHGDVFLFDYQGSGETGGEVTTEKFLAMGDGLEAAIRERAAGRRLILWGHSLGGVVCADMLHRLPETDGIILEATARNATEVAKAWTPWYAGPFVKITIEPGLKAYDVATLLKGFKGPVLVLGATLDKTLPVQLARSLDKALKEEGLDATYIEFKEGGHSSLPGQAGVFESDRRLFQPGFMSPAKLPALDCGADPPDLAGMFGELYHNRVLELAADIPHAGRLADADGSSLKVSRVCGSTVEVDVKLDAEGRICRDRGRSQGVRAGAGGDVHPCPSRHWPVAGGDRSRARCVDAPC